MIWGKVLGEGKKIIQIAVKQHFFKYNQFRQIGFR